MGSFPETCPTRANTYYETHFIINSEGNIASSYRKIHMFDVELNEIGGVDYNESSFVEHGNKVEDPCFSPIGYLGLSVAYDIRFPELYRHLVLKGAQVLLVPAAFLAKTGAAHWETLLRTRAIENQAYVIAAA